MRKEKDIKTKRGAPSSATKRRKRIKALNQKHGIHAAPDKGWYIYRVNIYSENKSESLSLAM